MADQDYNFLSQDTTKSPQDYITGWQQVQKNALDIQQAQAQVEQGKAAQAAIDPATGRFDQSKYMQILAGNPMASRGALAAAQGGVTLDTNTYDLHSKRLDAANSAMAQLIADNPGGVPGDAMHAAIERQRALGNLTDQEAQAEHAQVNSNPTANTQLLLQGLGHGLAVKTALDAAKPPTQTVTVPQGVLPITPKAQISSSPGGGVVQGTGGVAAGVPPGETQEYIFTPVDANGKPTGTPYNVTAPKGTVFPSMQGTQITPAAAPAAGIAGAANPPGTPAAGSAGIGTGRINPTPSNPALRNPANAQPSGGAAAAAPSTPSAPSGAVATGLPMGQPQQLGADLEARNKDVATIPQQQTQLQNMKHAYDALSFITTGKGQQLPNSVFNALAGYGLLPQGAVNRAEKYEEYKKYATQAIINQGLLQGTDLGRQLSQSANPSELLMTEANRELLRNNMGSAIQGMATAAAEKDQTSPSAASGYLSRRSNTSSNTDPRGFVWSLYSPGEQQKMLADAAAADKRNGNTNASDRLHRAIGMSSSIPALALPFQQ